MLKKVLPLGLLVLIIFFVFNDLMNYDFTNWDDDLYVLDSELVKNGSLIDAFRSFTVGLYTPMVTLSYKLDLTLFGMDAGGFHLTNLILHCLNCLLVYFLANHFLKDPLPSILVAAAFAFHPFHVEPLSWISSRKDLLFTLFYLISLIIYLKKKQAYYFIMLFTFILACLSKPAAVSFPVLLVLHYFLIEKKRDLKEYLNLIPFFLISLLFGLATIYGASELNLRTSIDTGYTGIEYFLMATYSIPFYLSKILLPLDLVNFYPYPAPESDFPLLYIISPLLLVMLIGIYYWIYKKDMTLFFLLCFAIIAVLPSLRFNPLGYPLVADRYFYLASFGILILPGYLTIKYSNKRRLILSIFSMSILVMALMSRSQIKVWKNSDTLWSNTIEKHPDFYYSYRERGRYYERINLNQKAISDYQKAYALNPNELALATKIANLIALENPEAALELQDEIVNAQGDASSFYNRANSFKAKRQFKEAIEDYSKALELDSNLAQAYNNRGVCYVLSGDTLKAFNDFEKAIKKEPGNQMFQDNYARLKVYFE